MTQAIIRPSAVGDESNCGVYGDTPGWKCVDEEVADADTTYGLCYSAQSLRDLYNLGDVALAGTINYVRVYVRARRTATIAISARTAIKLGETVVEGSDFALVGTYADYYTEHTTKPGGGAWTFADINNLQAGVHLNIYSAGVNSRCTQVWVVVDYEPAKGRSVAHIMG